ncbi:hypothetical protein ACWFRF_17495 [Nocardia sp. NPDC055165]
MRVPITPPDLEPKPHPGPHNTDPIAVLALAFSAAALAGVVFKSPELAITAWGAVMTALWNPPGGKRR